MKLLNSVSGSISGTGNTTWSYVGNESPNEFEFINDSEGEAVLTIGLYTFTVKPGEILATHLPAEFDIIDIDMVGDFRLLVGS